MHVSTHSKQLYLAQLVIHSKSSVLGCIFPVSLSFLILLCFRHWTPRRAIRSNEGNCSRRCDVLCWWIFNCFLPFALWGASSRVNDWSWPQESSTVAVFFLPSSGRSVPVLRWKSWCAVIQGIEGSVQYWLGSCSLSPWQTVWFFSRRHWLVFGPRSPLEMGGGLAKNHWRDPAPKALENFREIFRPFLWLFWIPNWPTPPPAEWLIGFPKKKVIH